MNGRHPSRIALRYLLQVAAIVALVASLIVAGAVALGARAILQGI